MMADLGGEQHGHRRSVTAEAAATTAPKAATTTAAGAAIRPLGLRCEECWARRSDGSRRWCARRRYANATGEPSAVKSATSPWWRDADGVLARVRGDAAVVREIISLRGL
jgi:hypothetical protein